VSFVVQEAIAHSGVWTRSW